MKTIFAAALLVVSTITGAAQAQSPSELNDLEIAHVAYTAGSIDIRYAHLALALSNDPKIRKFAETMIRDHTAVNQQALALVKKLGITPKDNNVSRDLVKQSKALIAELRTLNGPAFNTRYANNELEYHRFVNGAVGTIFIPNAKNAELKALLKSALKVFKLHEGHAEQMVKVVN
ncbi:MAG: DUF4142 domain-containing protein [Hyphomicrobiaceae bacterium]